MTTLRERAEKEVEADRQEKQRREEERAKRAKLEHEDRAKPAAEWLSKWSGVTVTPTDLTREDQIFPGFHAYATWRVQIEDFDLLLKQEKRAKPMLEEHTPDWSFQLHQRLPDGETRKIERPADLLAAIPQGEPVWEE